MNKKIAANLYYLGFRRPSYAQGISSDLKKYWFSMVLDRKFYLQYINTMLKPSLTFENEDKGLAWFLYLMTYQPL